MMLVKNNGSKKMSSRIFKRSIPVYLPSIKQSQGLLEVVQVIEGAGDIYVADLAHRERLAFFSYGQHVSEKA